ncbi:hypothetical protein H920_20193 [Fukomys damarensis]|uniref:Uncharacterized protein n=1 Tax=Fukomys damarensis TaxID=885580 RepID=A0A091CMX3_FUKDA|nr:hypothetical protein H920_20193 [Fukomys damarensis]
MPDLLDGSSSAQSPHLKSGSSSVVRSKIKEEGGNWAKFKCHINNQQILASTLHDAQAVHVLDSPRMQVSPLNSMDPVGRNSVFVICVSIVPRAALSLQRMQSWHVSKQVNERIGAPQVWQSLNKPEDEGVAITDVRPVLVAGAQSAPLGGSSTLRPGATRGGTRHWNCDLEEDTGDPHALPLWLCRRDAELPDTVTRAREDREKPWHPGAANMGCQDRKVTTLTHLIQDSCVSPVRDHGLLLFSAMYRVTVLKHTCHRLGTILRLFKYPLTELGPSSVPIHHR